MLVLTTFSSKMAAISTRVSWLFCPLLFALLPGCADDKEFVPEPVMSVRRSQIQEMEERGDRFMQVAI